MIKAYDLRIAWAIDSQVYLMFQRVKSEMLTICDDAEFLQRYASDLERLDKHIDLHVIVRNPDLAEHVGITCYIGGRDVESGMFCPPVPGGKSVSLKIAMYSDRQDFLLVVEENCELGRVFLPNDLFSGYIYHCVLSEIKPIQFKASSAK